MRVAREAVMSALVTQLETATFARAVTGVTSWKSVSRKLLMFDQVQLAQRPFLIVTDHHENWSYQSENTPPKLTLRCNLFVYTNAKGSTNSPASDLNVIMDAIDAALQSPFGAQTLGGLVAHCRVDGEVLKDPGDIDGDGLLWVPIKILGP